MNKSKNILIVLEGVDGIGKTTILNQLQKKLIKLGICAILTKEPSNSLNGFEIRNVLLNTKYHLTPMNELLLFLLDRNIHIENKIKILKENKNQKNTVILCDRSFYSTFVYQGKIGKIPLDDIYELHKKSNSFFWPDLTFFVDVINEKDYEIINERRLNKKDRIESKTENKYKEISKFYTEIKKYFQIKKPDLNIKTIKWVKETDKMVNFILKEIIFKLNENQY